MSAHAEQVYPEECCGLMLGDRYSEDGSTHKQLIQLVPLPNQWTEEVFSEASTPSNETKRPQTKRRRYWIDPKDMLRVQRESREKGLNIIGVYHSHPDHKAVPSECDRVLAWPEYAYVIVSVCEGKAVDVRNWALDSEHQFHPEVMKVSPSSATDRMPISA